MVFSRNYSQNSKNSGQSKYTYYVKNEKLGIKVLIGQRRTGKSYLLYQLMDTLHQTNPGSNIIYINKELSDFDFISNYEELNIFVKKQTKPGKNYLFIDEIQDINDFGKALRNLLASGKYDIYCTGSNARLLSGDIAGHLSGRFLEIKVYGLSFSEFLHFHQLENDDLALQKYMQFGGLPYLVHLVLTQNVVTEYLTNVYHTVLFKPQIRKQMRKSVFRIKFSKNSQYFSFFSWLFCKAGRITRI